MRALAMLSGWQLKNALLLTFRDRRRLVLLLCLTAFLLCLRQGPVWHMAQSTFNSPDTGRTLASYLPAIHAGVFLLLVLCACTEIDRACVSAVLEFSPADVDYLFPSPCSRRLLLAAKLPVIAGNTAAITGMLTAGFSLLWLPLASLRPGHSAHAAQAAIAALALCLGLYGNLAIGIELFCIRKTGRMIRRALIAVTAIVGSGVGIALWRHGLAGLASAAGNPLLSILFFPCRWCADAALNPLVGQSNTAQAAGLALVFALTLVLLFIRGANYYEAAMMASEVSRSRRTAVAAGQMLPLPGRFSRPDRPSRLFTIPAFGHGAGAILWANLAAALKRPFLFVLPFFGGALLVFVSVALPAPPPAGGDGLLALLNGYLVVLLPAMAGQGTYQRALGRQPLVRALPVPDWQAVAAEAVPRVVPLALCCLAECITLLALRHPHPLVYVPVLLIGLPLEVFCLNLLLYGVVLSYPGLQDKFQTLQAAFLNAILIAVVLSVQALFGILPAQAGLFPAAIPWMLITGVLLTTALIFSFTTRLYRAYQPAEDIPAGWKRNRARRMPEPDEALALAIVFPWLALYGTLWVHAYYPEWSRANLFLNLLLGEGGLIAIPALLFAMIGRYQWVETFSWRRATGGEMAGAALIGLGSLPWVGAIILAQNHLWPADPTRTEMVLGTFLPTLHQHPILAPLAIGVAAGVSEEILYRGPILAGLRSRLPLWLAIVITGFLFAAIHMDAHGLLFRTLLGVLLGWIVARSGSLFPAMLMHGIIDTACFGYYAWAVHRYGVAGFLGLVRHPPPLPPLYQGAALAVGTALLWAGVSLCRLTWNSRLPR